MQVRRRQKMIDGIEYDVVYARGIYCYLQNRPHLVRWTKRKMRRRWRRELEKELEGEV